MLDQYFANDGGPLIALDFEDVGLWPGGIGPEVDSDYARACAADYPAGMLPLGSNFVVVIGAKEGIGTAWWLSSSVEHLFLVGCVYADDDCDEDLARFLHSEGPSWTPLGPMVVRSGRVLLFHAACRLSDIIIDSNNKPAVIGDALSAAITPGNYSLGACEVSLPDSALYNVVRWTKV